MMSKALAIRPGSPVMRLSGILASKLLIEAVDWRDIGPLIGAILASWVAAAA
jgi:hypothetical protein